MKIRVMNISDYEQVYQLWLSCKGMGLNNDSFANVGVGENNAVSGRIKCVQHSEKFS